MQQLVSVLVGLVSRMIAHDPDNWLTKSAYRLDKLLLKVPLMSYMFRRVIIVGNSRK